MGETVVFDLDGTLADTSRDLIEAANAIFETRGQGAPLDPVADAATAFRGGRAMLERGYERVGQSPDPDADYHDFLDAYVARIDAHTTLYDGAREAVTALSAAGYVCSICTNKPAHMAELLMRNLGFRDPFAALVGADTLPVRKPDPEPYRQSVLRAGGDPARSLIVGDTATDRDTGRNAGVPVVLVAFGPTGRAVEALDPDHVIDHFDELPDLVARLLPRQKVRTP